MGSEPRFQSKVCGAESALAGANMKAERLGGVAQRKLLELDEHQQLPLLVRQGLEDSVDQAPRFAALGFLVRRLSARVSDGRVGKPLDAPGVALFRAPIVFRDAQHDAVDPGLERGAALELGPAAMEDDEDVLHRILELSLRHTQAPKTAPDPREMLGVDRAQRCVESGGFERRVRLGWTFDTDHESHDAIG
jgi:hypothetical protein